MMITAHDDADIPLAVQHADQVVTGQQSLDDARRFADRVRRGAREIGRVNGPVIVQNLVLLIVPGQAEADLLKQGLASAFFGHARVGAMRSRDLMTVADRQLFIGTANSFADFVACWLDTGATDGFRLSWPYPSQGLEIFVQDIRPRLAAKSWFGAK